MVGSRREVVVKIISTQFIETDAVNFKSLVQKLTGKDSTAASVGTTKSFGVENVVRPESVPGGTAMVDGASMSIDLKELDRLLMGLPSMDELCGFLPD
ncbi:PREDICTED: VQ motif-containing protein 10-like [Nelumbo nucifera]|uniref:VQ domain-containing protein n=2 Tax=Nelumbo nucifera TaxID=4432 RepID=A0A822YY16_NELNU|nr:PREDICTED: VQ motif-containing protein 10-like [Nelumbo nucifera]DAD37562.1 TPA_asm: hypothetical protein HUJ06_008203 [Nelumbo nucifera]